MKDLLDWAWTINAGDGDWDKETPEWKTAAERWRDAYHAEPEKSGEERMR